MVIFNSYVSLPEGTYLDITLNNGGFPMGFPFFAMEMSSEKASPCLPGRLAQGAVDQCRRICRDPNPSSPGGRWGNLAVATGTWEITRLPHLVYIWVNYNISLT